MQKSRIFVLFVLAAASALWLFTSCAASGDVRPTTEEAEVVRRVWKWTAILFVFTLVIGVIAPISGVGGGVLFVPLATAMFPFSVDFVRGAGLVLAMVSAQSSAPHLMRKGLANLRVVAPVAVVSILTAVGGSIFGLWLTNSFPHGEHYITIALGGVLLFVFWLMLKSEGTAYPEVDDVGPLAEALELGGEWYEHDREEKVEYQSTRMRMGALCFAVVGFLGGALGVGAGWANVPVLNMVMGTPLKVATATSMGIIAVNSSAASWVFLSKGAILPMIVVPSVIGITIGARIGARISHRTKPVFVKYLVLAILVLAAFVDIYKGLDGLGVF